MVADPCNSTLVPGIFGDQDGLLARLKLSIMNPGNNAQTAGYLLWCPDYHCIPDVAASFVFGKGNLFAWSSTHSYLNPTNTPAFPYGGENTPWNPTQDSAGTINDPAGKFLKTELVQDARTISSCMKLTYTGPMLSSSGQYAFIEALPLSSLLEGGDNAGQPIPPSVDNLFQLATKTGRLGTDTLEVISRPDDSSQTFRSSDVTPIEVEDQGGLTASILSTEGKTQQPLVYGIAWRGLSATESSPLILDVIKNIEWRPRPVSGLTHAVPRGINPTPMVHKAVTYLDTNHPGWSTKMLAGAASGVASIAKAAFTGVGNSLVNEFTSGRILGDLAGIAPLALTML